MRPVISVIVPAYNAEPWIGRCLDSILEQTYPDFEIIAINDGSVDATPTILDDYARRDPRVRAIHQTNRGVGPTRNRGIEEAEGEWIAFIDADDTIPPDFLAKLIARTDDPDIDIVIAHLNFIAPEGRVIRYPFAPLRRTMTSRQAVREAFRFLPIPLLVTNKLYRRSIFVNHDLRFFDIWYEDGVLLIMFLLNARAVAYERKTSYGYHRHETSLTSNFTERHLSFYMQAVNLIRHYLADNDLWDLWRWNFRDYLNRIMIFITILLIRFGAPMSFKERWRLFKKALTTLHRLKKCPDEEESPYVLTSLAR